MSAKYQHPIRTDRPLVIAYPDSGPAAHYAQLHAEGCSHVLKGSRHQPNPFRGDDAYFADDFFMVAPCARAKVSRRKTKS